MTNRINWTSIASADTGFVFAYGNPSIFNRWNWITEVVGHHFDHDPDELDLEEAHDGREFVTFRGERLAQIVAGYHKFAPAVFAQAAE